MSLKKVLLIGALAMGTGYILGLLKGDKRFREVVGRTQRSNVSEFPPSMHGTQNPITD